MVAIAAIAVLLAGCTPTPPAASRALNAPFAIPQDLTYQYVTCADECAAQYRLEPRADGFTYVDAYERSQLWDYYTAVTAPCLVARGVTLEPPTREDFFVPDQRPWNPYTTMDDLPFDELVALYRACPPVPDYLRERHEP